MKQALILSLGLAVIMGLTGCATGNKFKDAANVVVDIVEKPVMVLSEELKRAANVAGDDAEATGKIIKDGAESVVKTDEDLLEDAGMMVEIIE